MEESIQNELSMLMNVDSVSGTERNKIMAIANDFLNSTKYMTEIKYSMSKLFSLPDLDFKSELPKIVLNIIMLNNKVNYYKEIKQSRSKYLIYAILYHYLLKYQTEILNKQDIGQFRLLYSNCWDLINTNCVTIVKRHWYDFLTCCIGNANSSKLSI